VTGCNPCPYCDPEFDDCDESAVLGHPDPNPGGHIVSAGPPCNPCRYNDPVVYGNASGINQYHCPGADTCAHYPSCPDCSTFLSCNAKFHAVLYGRCNSVMEVTAP
jgi:hypothetical protein